MKKALQIGILIVLLVIPIFIFLFLHLFGQNQYRLPLISPYEEMQALQVYSPKVVNCSPSEVEGIHRIPPFRLTNQEGQPFGHQELEGSIYVADFFFTRCPNICIEMASSMLRVQEKFKKFPQVRQVSFTVDPAYDQPEVLQEYVAKYGINTNKWTLLTGEQADIYEMARCGFFIVAKPSEERENDFIHSDKLVLVDKDKRIRGYYSGTDREDVDRLITELQVLLKEYEQ